MGIKGLTKFLGDLAPRSIEALNVSSLTGRVLAIDASMALYQFLIAIREGDHFANLENAAGETTSHIAGMLNRAIRLMELGAKPIFVFDGEPPQLKGGELAKRKNRRDQAEKELKEAEDMGDREDIKKQIGRTVKVTQQHNKDVKRLLQLMGIPTVDAPCEAEAQCAEITKSGKAYATVSEDADSLTFGSSILIRNLTFSDARTKTHPPLTINLSRALNDLELTMPQFVDFCILCGCDYCDTIRGVGAKKAFAMIKERKTIECIIENIEKEKMSLPERFPYEEARDFFNNPKIIKASELPPLKWREADAQGLKEFLINEQSFNPLRVEGILKRLKNAYGKSSQTRLEAFFSKPIERMEIKENVGNKNMEKKRGIENDKVQKKNIKKKKSG